MRAKISFPASIRVCAYDRMSEVSVERSQVGGRESLIEPRAGMWTSRPVEERAEVSAV